MSDKILNVTPAEFSEIAIASVQLRDADFVAFMCGRYGCRPFAMYRVVVRKDVPSIPWLSWGVQRIEEAYP